MKKIAYSRPDGGLSVVSPVEGARLAAAVVLADGSRREAPAAIPVDRFFMQWPVDGVAAEWAETEDEFIARVVARSVPADATDVRVIDADALPADRTFRDAWRLGGDAIVHDMEACRGIHRDRLRALRKPLLDALDVEYMRADEAGDARAKAGIVARKQALRDVTRDPAIAAADTPEALKAVVPAALAG